MNYHIARDGQQLGTFSKDEVLAKIQQGSIKPSDLAWTEGMADWKPAAEVFAEAFATPAAATGPEVTAPAAPPTPPPMASAPVAPAAASSVSAAVPPKPENYLVWAILTTVLCCLPLGIVSIIFAAQVDGKYKSGDYAGALESSRKARAFAWWSFGVGIVVALIVVAIQAIAFITAAAAANANY